MKTLRARIMLLIGVTMAILLTAMTAALYFQISDRVTAISESFSEEIARAEAEGLGKILEGIAEELAIHAQNPVLREGDLTAIESYLVGIKGNIRDSYEMVFYADAAGEFRTTLGNVGNIGDRDYFKAIIGQGKEQATSELLISRSTGQPIITIAQAVRNDQNKIQGLLAVTLLVETITEIVDEIQIGQSGYASIVDRDGLVLAHPDSTIRMQLKLQDSAKLGFVGFDQAGRDMRSSTFGMNLIKTPTGEEELIFHRDIPNSPGWDLAIIIPRTQLLSEVSHLLRLVVIISAVVLLVALTVSFFIAMGIAKPITTLAGNIETMARGDLRSSVDIERKDEVGQMAGAFNAMTQDLRALVGSVQDSVRESASSSQQLAATSEEYSAALEEVASTLNQFSQTINIVHTDAVEVSTRAEQIGTLSNQGLNRMGNTAESMQRIRTSSAESRMAITELGQSTQEINEIVSLISAIADQTNLLALNAAIEAARAGENGRGFAVVADEVRKLAEQTQKSISNIGPLVERLRRNMEVAVDVTDRTNDEVEKGISALQQAQESSQAIASSTKDIITLIEGVTSSMGELDEGGESVAAAIEEQSASMQEIANAAQSVASLSGRLEGLVRHFLT